MKWFISQVALQTQANLQDIQVHVIIASKSHSNHNIKQNFEHFTQATKPLHIESFLFWYKGHTSTCVK